MASGKQKVKVQKVHPSSMFRKVKNVSNSLIMTKKHSALRIPSLKTVLSRRRFRSVAFSVFPGIENGEAERQNRAVLVQHRPARRNSKGRKRRRFQCRTAGQKMRLLSRNSANLGPFCRAVARKCRFPLRAHSHSHVLVTAVQKANVSTERIRHGRGRGHRSLRILIQTA